MNALQKKKILIAGGGPGGLALALGLLRAGFDVKVYETRKNYANAGNGIILYANALKAIRQLEPRAHQALDDLLQLKGALEGEVQLRTLDGRLLESSQIEGRIQAEGPMLVIRYARLCQILSGLLPTGVLEMSSKVTGFEQTADKVVLRLKDGRHAEGDFLFGVDGHRSFVRQKLFGVPTRYINVTVVQGIAENVSDDYPKQTHYISFKEGLQFWHVQFTEEGSSHYWMKSVFDLEQLESWNQLPKEQLLKAFKNAFKHFPESALNLIEKTKPKHLLLTKIYHIPHLDSWSQGRVALVGDSAHAMEPYLSSGTSFAWEDSVCLIRSLLKHPDNHQQAFSNYYEERIARVSSFEEFNRKMTQRTTLLNSPVPEGMSPEQDKERRKKAQEWMAEHVPKMGRQGKFFEQPGFMEGSE